MKNTLKMIALLSLLCACSGQKEKKEEGEEEKATEVVDNEPVEVKVRPLKYEDFSYDLISNGTVSATNKAELRFQSQEIIRKILVKNGDWVNEGQKLAELDKFKLESALRQAEESFERANLDFQDVLIGQGYSLNDRGNVPNDVMRIAQIRSNYLQNENNLEMARYNLNAATLLAPFPGVIANLTAKEFNLPGGDPFCVLIDNRQPEVTFHILENELPLINLNDKVTVSPFSTPSFTTEGRVTEINPLIDRNGMVRIKAKITNRENAFFEGMNVKVKVQRILGERLVIPKSALVLRNNKKVVFTLINDRANWVYVETDQENADSYVVTDGLRPGDVVIYDGNLTLAHDTKVKLKVKN